MMPRAERLASFISVDLSRRLPSDSGSVIPANPAASAYQPASQLVFLLVERFLEVNLYSSPTEMAKFTSYCP